MSKYRFHLAQNCAKLDRTAQNMNTVSHLLSVVEKVIRAAPELSSDQINNRIKSLRYSAQVICSHVGEMRPPSETPIKTIVISETERKKRLIEISSETMRTRHIGHWRQLLEFAKALAIPHELFDIEREWERLKFIGMDPTAERLINDLKRDLIRPSSVTQDHLDTWKKGRRNKSQSGESLERSISQFKYRIRQAKLQAQFPKLNVDPIQGSRYSKAMKKWHPRARAEFTAILKWLAEQDEREVIRMCEQTRKGIVIDMERLYGYAVRFYQPLRGKPITRLNQILIRGVITAYARWLYKTRGYLRRSIGRVIHSFHSVLKVHPAFKKKEWGWMIDFIKEFPAKPESSIEEQRAKRAFDYDMETLSTIPAIVRNERESSVHLSKRDKARSIRDQFLAFFLVKYPWPSRCLRECRIGGKSPNLYKKSRTKGAPKEWYFYFRPEEVPRRRLAKGWLPKVLVPLLNLYLKFRRYLQKGNDPGRLLLNNDGGALSETRFYLLVCKISEDSIGTPVPPTGFRDAYGYDRLVNHNDDFGTLASLRWETEYWVRMKFDRDFRNAERAIRRKRERSK